jgi:hypothetical protein
MKPFPIFHTQKHGAYSTAGRPAPYTSDRADQRFYQKSALRSIRVIRAPSKSHSRISTPPFSRWKPASEYAKLAIT